MKRTGSLAFLSVVRPGGRPLSPLRRTAPHWTPLVWAGAFAVVLILLAGGVPTKSWGTGPSASGAPEGKPMHPGASSAPVGAHPVAALAGHPAAGPAPLPCYPLTKYACVRLANATVPNIIPIGTSHVASYEPNATDNIPLLIYSEKQLNWANASSSGPNSPIAPNLTEILWNGNPWFCYCDGSVWHAQSPSSPWYRVEMGLWRTNRTYPFVYSFTIWNRSTGGSPNFYAGATVYWTIEFTNFTASSNSYSHEESNTLSYRIAGAWAYSPWPGSVQYAGASAAAGDLTIKHSPLTPNWNDTLNVTIRITSDDVTNRTAIAWAMLFIQEFHNGVAIANVTETPFAIATFGTTGLRGNDTSTQVIPSWFTQVAGNMLVFWVTARDTAPYQNDSITLAPTYLNVSGNGSFPQGIFNDDLAISTDPSTVYKNQSSATLPVIRPGENVTVNVTSRSASTSILSAVIFYTFSYPTLPENVTTPLPMNRINSTTFHVTIPGMPLNSTVNFTIDVLDYTHHLDRSDQLTYSTQSYDNFTLSTPKNNTFFYVYVYNNQSRSYLSGVVVQIRSPTPAINSVSTTRFGIAYPNASGNDFVPLLVGANASYNISVTSTSISGIAGGHSIWVSVYATNPMDAHHPLARGSDYFVVQEGNQIYFWVNGTLPTTVYSASAASTGVADSLQIAALLGLGGSLVMAFVLWRWFSRIQLRRKEEEKRVTL